ncbi:MAG: outer membrane protein assembly factor BamD [Elusimicrobiota bacterium]
MKKILIAVAAVIIVVVGFLILSRPKLDETDAFRILESARANYSRDNLGGALEQFRLLLKKYPKSKYAEESQRFVIYIYEKKQDITGLVAEYERYLKKFRNTPYTAEFSYKTGYILYKFLSKEKPARVVLIRVVKEYPDSEWTKKSKQLITEIYKAKGKNDEIIKLAQEYPEKDTDNIPFNISQMEAYWREGKHDEAYNIAKKIPKKTSQIQEHTIYWQLLVKYEPSRENYSGLATAYQKLGFPERAQEYRKKAAQIKK